MSLIPYIPNRLNRAPAGELADLLGWAFPASFVPARDDAFRFHEDKDNYYAALDLPGVGKEDLSLDTDRKSVV